MMYKIYVKCERTNHTAFLELETKFRRMLEELSMSAGAESICTQGVEVSNTFPIDDSTRIVEYQKMIDGKYHEQQE